MLYLRAAELDGSAKDQALHDIFGPDFLLKRPLLQAIETPAGATPPVLLVDELDRADDEFEAFLLEILSEFQITIPEIGTIRAQTPPIVILTSNRTRDIHDALKRRCLYHWIEYPSLAKEIAIVQARLPGVGDRLSQQVVAFRPPCPMWTTFCPSIIWPRSNNWARCLGKRCGGRMRRA